MIPDPSIYRPAPIEPKFVLIEHCINDTGFRFLSASECTGPREVLTDKQQTECCQIGSAPFSPRRKNPRFFVPDLGIIDLLKWQH